jgi:hypothetical protein
LFFSSKVQLRQKTNQKKTLYYVEQLLIKYDATKECSAIKAVGGKYFVMIQALNPGTLEPISGRSTD